MQRTTIFTMMIVLYVGFTKTQGDDHMRDQQRQQLYDAERRAEDKLRQLHRTHSRPSARPVDVGLTQITDVACQPYVDEVCDHVGVKRVTVKFVEPRDLAIYHRDDAEMILPPWARNKITILHELAHHLTHRYYPGHGAEFVENFLMLTRTFLSPTVAQIFMDEFLDEGVEVKSSGKQGLRFMTYALKLSRRGKSKRVVVITNEPKRYVGWLMEFDRTDQLVLGKLENSQRALHRINADSIRYATWWDGQTM